MKQPVCAVFDIGRVNKKVIVFNENFECVEEIEVEIPTIFDSNGFRCEDIFAIKNWILDSFKKLRSSEKFTLRAVNFVSYAGSMVHLDKGGNAVTPVYDVLTSLPYAVERQFKEEVVAKYDLLVKTESPYLGIMNAGVQLYWLKNTHPETFEKISTSIFLPQYGYFLLTGKLAAEKSNLECHSMLWDREMNDYHSWLKEHGLRHLLPEVINADSVSPALADKNVMVGVGLQNSVASLLMYEHVTEPYVLSSSHEWTINSNPFSKNKLSIQNLERHSFSFELPNKNLVHASRVFAGNEHDRQVKNLASYFDKPLDFYKKIQYNADLVWKLRERFQQATPDTTDPRLLLDCAFVERNINQFKNYEEAYHQFMLDLVAQEAASLKLILGYSKTKKIILEGDFVKNEIYVQLMNEVFFDKFIYINENDYSGTAGAATIICEHWAVKCPEVLNVKLTKV
ncbi:MAG: FGGY family carbohydrate kinase [Spirosomaceae bacterium]|nr:FGGY family carbohydrate kinase [Spirosomataceae bacterium]